MVYYGPDQYGFLEYNRGDLEGYAFIRKGELTYFGEFNNNKNINRALLINLEDRVVKILSYKSPVYEVVEENHMG